MLIVVMYTCSSYKSHFDYKIRLLRPNFVRFLRFYFCQLSHVSWSDPNKQARLTDIFKTPYFRTFTDLQMDVPLFQIKGDWLRSARG
jgi:hypothetical protein